MGQINVRLSTKLNTKFTEMAERAFLRRDAFLGHVLRQEVTKATAELSGLVNSPKARKFIASSLEGYERSSSTIALPDDVIESINGLCQTHNIVRDSLFNRILFLLTSGPKTFVLVFGFPEQVLNVIAEESIEGKNGTRISSSYDWPRPSSLKDFNSVELARDLLDSPFMVWREMVEIMKDESLGLAGDEEEDWKDQNLSRLTLSATASAMQIPRLMGLNLYMPDVTVPGTAAHKAAAKAANRMLEEFDNL